MWQQVVIALLIVLAAGYVAWTFLPMMQRQRLLDALAAHGVLVRAAAQHRARLATPGCSNCAASGEHAATSPRSRKRLPT
jgi:hypothetical protein